jgi:hypothetical protein
MLRVSELTKKVCGFALSGLRKNSGCPPLINSYLRHELHSSQSLCSECIDGKLCRIRNLILVFTQAAPGRVQPETRRDPPLPGRGLARLATKSEFVSNNESETDRTISRQRCKNYLILYVYWVGILKSSPPSHPPV